MTNNEPPLFTQYQEAQLTLRVWESIICDDTVAGLPLTQYAKDGHAAAKAEFEKTRDLLHAATPSTLLDMP